MNEGGLIKLHSCMAQKSVKRNFIDIEQSGELADSECLIKQRGKKRGWTDGDWQLAPRRISFLSLFYSFLFVDMVFY